MLGCFGDCMLELQSWHMHTHTQISDPFASNFHRLPYLLLEGSLLIIFPSEKHTMLCSAFVDAVPIV